MSCFHPIECWRMDNQTKLSFRLDSKGELEKHRLEKLRVPCGRCIGCMLDRANDWATRCWCQNQTCDPNNCCFITLTYNNENLPEGNWLKIKDEQDFWKRLRYYYPENKIQYFGCGEYGPSGTHRCHWHFCVWGYKPKDLKFYKYNKWGDKLYTSKELKDIWGKGYVVIGEITYKSACYVSRYCSKKLFKEQKWAKQIDVKPECTICSKGIGLEYWNKFKEKIKQNNGIILKIDKKTKNKRIPKYYIKKWEVEDPEECEIYKFEKQESGIKNWEKILENTTLTEQEYLEQTEKQLLEKSEQLLKRTNFI